MNFAERLIFYGNMAQIVPRFFLDSLEKDSVLEKERKKFLDKVFENFKFKERENAYSELERMASDFHPEFLKKWKAVVEKKILRPQFKSIIVEGRENLVQKENEVITFVSSHRSLYDIPILGAIFYDSGIKPPVYTAGSNLAKGPFKYGLKKMGGALLDREKLRAADRFEISLAMHYFTSLGLNFINTVNFIEGTRSRTTAFDKINNMFIKPSITAQLEKKDVNYKVIPVTESYDRIPEDSELIRVKIASGKDKTLIEKIKEIERLHTWVGNNFGNVYVTFGKPICLKEFLGLEKEEISKVNVKEKIEELKERIEGELKKNYKITPFMLMAYSLLKGGENFTLAYKTYINGAEEFKKQGFNINNENPKELFYKIYSHPFTKRMAKKEELINYYAAFVQSIGE